MLTFLGIGGQKCGTTWLYEALKGHPSIGFPRGKECHFWNSEVNAEGLIRYKDSFNDPLRVEGEITPAYSFLRPERIEVIKKHFPRIRAILLVRDPRLRAWSGALMALRRSEMLFDEASDQWFIDHFNSYGSLMRGRFLSAIQNWSLALGESNLFFRNVNVVWRDPVTELNNICSFLGLANFYTEDDMSNLLSPVFRGNGEAIRKSLIPILDDLYFKEIEQLNRHFDLNIENSL